MAKKAKSKKVRAPKKGKIAKVSRPPDAEWAFVEERYSNLTADFGALAREIGT